MPQKDAACSNPCDQTALLLDREEGRNKCGRLKSLDLDPQEKKKVTPDRQLELACKMQPLGCTGEALRRSPKHTLCAKVKSN